MKAHAAIEAGTPGLVQFEILATSEGRSWVGLEATLHRASEGILIHGPCFLHYGASMSVGPPVTTDCRCGDLTYRGLQTPGNVDIIPLGAPYESEEDAPSTSLAVRLSRALVESTAESMRVPDRMLCIAPQLQIRDPKLEHICLALKAELEHGDPHERLYAEGLGIAMAAQLLHRYARAGDVAPKHGLTARQTRMAIDYIRSHLASDLSIAELAAVVGISASHFKALFRRSTGMPVHRYVMRQRVECAVDLIAHRRVRLSAAALQAGFADQSHMARCMRRILGITPTDVVRDAR